MNILLIISVVFANCARLVNGDDNTPCKTQTGKWDGECVPLRDCQPLLDLLSTKNTDEKLSLLKQWRSRCYSEEMTYCCPVKKGCVTPEGLAGDCIGLTSCLHLSNMLRPPNPNYEYVMKSRCGDPKQHSVCCGPPPIVTQRLGSDMEGCAAMMSAFPPDPKTLCCGKDNNFGNKIIRGNVTTIDDYPWLVIIEYIKNNTKHLLCSGSLISGKYVLTAGHCLIGRDLQGAKPVSVRLGEYDILNKGPDCTISEGGGPDCTDGITRIDIEEAIPYPDYNPAKGKKHDIALLRLKETAPFTDFIRPICLPSTDLTLPSNTPKDFVLFSAGWGQINSSQTYSQFKMHVELPYVELSKCQEDYIRYPLSRFQICAGGNGKDVCKGDSGGPLMYNVEMDSHTHYEIIGIVSFGKCSNNDVPAVYTKVNPYLEWIESTMVP